MARNEIPKGFEREYPILTCFFNDSEFREEVKKDCLDMRKRQQEIDLEIRRCVVIDSRTGRAYE